MKILGMGVPELVIILLVVLLIFGPKNLPKLGASLGKTVKNIRKGMGDEEDDKKIDEAVEVVDEDDADVDVVEEVEEAEEAVKKTATAAKKSTSTARKAAAKKKVDEDADAE